MEIVARAPADGYTIVSAAVGSWAVTPHFNKLPYDTQTDFAPIIQIATTPGVLVVHPSVAAKTVQDLIALARQKPGALNYAAGGLGGYSHVSAELFNSMTKIRMSGVPYKGAAPAMTELIGGHTQVMFNTGLGLIAEALAPRCKAFGMTVLGVTATPRPVEGFDRVYVYEQLAQAAALADFLVVLTPYSPERDKLIDAKILAAMKPGAFLLNLARGGLCDESALLDALRSKRIAGAGLDVFRSEPLPKESPFWDIDNVLITAHCSGSSDDNLAMTWPIIETIMRCFLEGRHGEMINVIRRTEFPFLKESTK